MTKPCAIDDCDRPAAKRIWCAMHYMRWRTHGDPCILLRPQKSQAECSIEGLRPAKPCLGLVLPPSQTLPAPR